MKNIITDTKKKKDGMVIINKFKDKNSIDVTSSLAKVFKIYYQSQANKNKI